MPYKPTKAQKRKSLEKLMIRYPQLQFDEVDRPMMESFMWNTSQKGNSSIRIQTRDNGTTAQGTRLLMARILGRELDNHERVRAINGNPLDLRRSNLIVTNTAELVKIARDSKKPVENLNAFRPLEKASQSVQVGNFKFTFNITVDVEEVEREAC